MTFHVASRIAFLAFSILVVSACGKNEEAKDSQPEATLAPITGMSSDEMTFTHKMMKKTGENMYASLAYECRACTFKQWLNINPPDGWSKGPAQILCASSGELRTTPVLDGVPETMDFTDEVPGNEYQLIAKNLDAVIIDTNDDGFIVEAEVLRDTVLRFDAGRRVHELTTPEGNVYVLFAYGVDPLNVILPNFENPEFFSAYPFPEGWTYSTRILEEELVLNSTGTVKVLAIRGGTIATWEMR